MGSYRSAPGTVPMGSGMSASRTSRNRESWRVGCVRGDPLCGLRAQSPGLALCSENGGDGIMDRPLTAKPTPADMFEVLVVVADRSPAQLCAQTCGAVVSEMGGVAWAPGLASYGVEAPQLRRNDGSHHVV